MQCGGPPQPGPAPKRRRIEANLDEDPLFAPPAGEVYDELSRDLQEYVLEKWSSIRTHVVHGPVQTRYNRRLTSLNTRDLHESLHVLFEQQTTKFRINLSYGFILKQKQNGRFKYYHSSGNCCGRYLEEPSLIENRADFDQFLERIHESDIRQTSFKWLKDRRQRVVVDGEVSSWKSVLSGVPQGSVLGPILFLVYINDLEEGVTGKILKFADDTKLFRKVKEIGDKQNLQDDIDKLVKWSEKWQMLFNFGKCKCLHTGSGNTGMNYEMGGTILSKTVKEKDLGVTMNANMKVSEQCRIAASKGNQVLGMIRRNITYKEKSLIIPLYKAIVRPHLEYCIQAWNPHLRKDVDMLEKIQRRATKLIPELRDLTYEERLKECGLTTLETRRLRGDQIEVFKILNGYENIDSNIFFEIKESKITRGHNYTLVKKQSRLDVRKFSFSQRTINIWNNLSTDCVHASSVNMFKNKIDKYLVKAGYT